MAKKEAQVEEPVEENLSVDQVDELFDELESIDN